MNILVSACLLGVTCRYSGKCEANEEVLALRARHTLIPVCPEQLGGLPTPRKPCEIRAGRVIDQAEADRTDAFRRGAEETLKIARLTGCDAAVLKSRSPSCGVGVVYDGTFSHTRVAGNGVTAQVLCDAGLSVCTEETLARLEVRS